MLLRSALQPMQALISLHRPNKFTTAVEQFISYPFLFIPMSQTLGNKLNLNGFDEFSVHAIILPGKFVARPDAVAESSMLLPAA